MSDVKKRDAEPLAISNEPQMVKQESEPALPGPQAAPATQDIVYPGFFLASLLNASLMLATFLVALDMSIVATAIPVITREFNSVDQVGWYGSAFFAGLAAFQAAWGKAYKFFPLKIVFLSCIFIFELGSLIVAVAPSSTAVIVGRAIQGAGGAGVTGGCYIIAAFITRPQHLPQITGIFSTVWSCSSVLGPVLGGVFTSELTWRWCFWINLPIGGATFIVLLLLFKTPAHSRVAHIEWKEIPIHFDFAGIALILGALICLLLALEDGGVTVPWSNSVPIGLLVGFSVILIAFSFVEWKQGERSMVNFRILKRKTIASAAVFGFCVHSASFARNYNLPLYFQAVQGVDPLNSGLRTLPTVVTGSIFSFFGSVLVGKIGHWQPVFWVGSIFLTVGGGLIYTLSETSTAGQWIGYQIVVSIGTGLNIMVPILIAQTTSSHADMSVTVSMALFFQFFGAAIGVSAAENIMNNVLIESILSSGRNISPQAVLTAGSSGLRQFFPNPADLVVVVSAYMNGLHAAWIWSIVLPVIGLIASFFGEWKSIKPATQKGTEKQKESQPTAAQESGARVGKGSRQAAEA